MAFVEIEVDPAEGGEFFRFNAIGDRLLGVFVSFEAKKGNFDKLDQNYTFRTKEGVVTVSASANLAMKLEKAALKPGHRVMVTYTGDLAATKPGFSAMKIFKVLVDSDPQTLAKPKPPPPPPAGDEFDDILL